MLSRAVQLFRVWILFSRAWWRVDVLFHVVILTLMMLMP
jgi:hypothetical protein